MRLSRSSTLNSSKFLGTLAKSLIKVKEISICGSDVRIQFAGDISLVKQYEYPFSPGVPCHEVTGIIEESGDPNICLLYSSDAADE